MFSCHTDFCSLWEILAFVIDEQRRDLPNLCSGFLSPKVLWYPLALQVSSPNATTISQPILQLSGDSQAQVAQGQDLNAAAGQTLQSVQLVNPGTFLIQAQTVTATGQIQWQTFQVSDRQSAGCWGGQVTLTPPVCAGSGCPVAAGAPVASGTGSDTAANLGPSPDSSTGPDGTGQFAQPADRHCELGVTRSPVHTGRGSKESNRYVPPPNTFTHVTRLKTNLATPPVVQVFTSKRSPTQKSGS